ncbi:MAG: hypothetical protein L0Y56_02030, partial [Nitrospira sp.]|nr:hypothetical protein [Nitrospira sp.]
MPEILQNPCIIKKLNLNVNRQLLECQDIFKRFFIFTGEITINQVLKSERQENAVSQPPEMDFWL